MNEIEQIRPVTSDVVPLGPTTVCDLTVDGGALARPGEKVLFLDKGIPGQQVMYSIIKEEKRFTRARVTGIRQASPDEVEPWCEDFSCCGGCAWQNISESRLLEWKQKHVQETLARIGGVKVSVTPVFASPLKKGYRTKISYAFGLANGKPALGLRERGSHGIAPVLFCGLQPAFTGRVLEKARELLSTGCPVWNDAPKGVEGRNQGYLRHLVLHTRMNRPDVEAGGDCVVELITGPQGKAPFHAIAREVLLRLLDDEQVAGVVHSERRGAAALAVGERQVFAQGETDCLSEYCGKAFAFPHDAFMQTNTTVASALYAKAMECAHITPSDRVWDLYCGTGAIGLLAVTGGARLFGTDGQESAIRYAIKNAAQLEVSEKSVFVSGNIEKSLMNAPFAPDCIFLDPPRAGVSQNCLDRVNKTSATRIVYVSCDVATQARDIRALGNHWRVSGVFPFDMFPATPHIENLCLLERV